MVKNLTANTRNMGLIPGPGRSRMPQGDAACAPQLLEPESSRARKPREKPVHSTGESPLLTMTRESPHSAVKTQHSQNKPQHTYATAHQESKRRKEHFTLEGFSVSLLLPTLQYMYPFPLIESFKVGGWEGECSNPQVPVCTHSAPQPHPTLVRGSEMGNAYCG